MRFQTELVPATLIQRYKRFLADCKLDTGETITAHCANPGSMLGLKEPGTRVWLEPNDDPKKKLKFSWKLVELPSGAFVGVDTGLPNRLLRDALQKGQVAALANYTDVRAEVPYHENARVDFLLTKPDGAQIYVEVKSVTLSRSKGIAEFPDSVTARGAKHMSALAAQCGPGTRAMLLYLVQRNDCTAFALAEDIDPTYARASRDAHAAGVEKLVLGTEISPLEITLSSEIQQPA